MFLYAVIFLKVGGCCEKFSEFCHGELASLLNGLTKWLDFGQVTDALNELKVMTTYARMQGA